MNKELHEEKEHGAPTSRPQEGSSDILGILKDIQQRLVFLERKVDNLILGQGSASGGGFNRERSFRRPDSKPFNRFSRPPHKRFARDGNAAGAGSSHQPGQRDDRPRDRGDRPSHFDKPRREGQGQPFSGPDFTKKKFFHRGKRK